MGALVKVKPAAEEIPGLAEADAKAAALHEKYLDLRKRISQAQADLAGVERKRGGLLEQAKAGEVIGAAEVAEAEAAVRTAEQTLMLLREAAPAVLKQAQDAESRLMSLACEPLRRQAEAAQARYDAAVKASEAAAKEQSAAWQANESIRLWTVTSSGPDQLRQHAPAAASRRAEVSRLLDGDRKAASAAFAQAQEDARIKSGARAWHERQIRESFQIQGRVLTQDELERQLAARGHG